MPTTETDWLIDASGDWSTASNWSTGTVPGPTFDVKLTPSTGTSPFTVTYNATDTVASLTGPAYASFDMTGGALTVTQTATLAGPLTNAGVLTLDNTGGPASSIGGALTNTGTVAVNAGTLTLTAYSTSAAGGLSVAAGATLSVSHAQLTLGAGTLTGAGALNLDQGILSSGAGAVTVDTPVTGQGFLETSGTVTLAAGFNGTFLVNHGSGTTILQGSSSVTETFNVEEGGVADNEGTLTLTGTAAQNVTVNLGSGLGDTGTLHNEAGATINLSYVTMAGVNNDGVIDKTGDNGTSSINNLSNNAGMVNVDSGELDIGSGSSSASGFHVASSATLSFDSSSSAYALNGGTMSGAGIVLFAGQGTVSGGASFGSDVHVAVPYLGSLTVESGASTVEGTFASLGTVTVASGATLSVPATPVGGLLDIEGTLSNTGDAIHVSTGTITGSGTVGNLSIDSQGVVAAGTSPHYGPTYSTGTLHAASLALASNATFQEAITSNSQFETVDVAGTVSLGQSDLELNINENDEPTPGQTFTIIDNEGANPVSGTFAGLAEGAQTILPTNNYAFSISYHGGDGNDVVLTAIGPQCFASGTLIRTTHGDRPVETLRVGDMVVTAAGDRRPTIWIGHRAVDCASHPEPATVWAYRVLAGAFGDNRPAQDLWLSPDHAVAVTCLSEVLIPIKHLDNGATVAQVPVDTVTYWHVELDRHDVLLAENLPAESFLDTRGRGFFDDAAAFDAATPRPRLKTVQDFCCPLVTEGPIIDAVRVQLLARAAQMGWTLDDADDLHLLADGVAIRPDVAGGRVRVVVPATTQALRLISRSFVPRHSDVATHDDRRLGIPIRALRVSDGLAVDRIVPLDDTVCLSGFHAPQEWDGDRWRWTDGAADLAADILAGCRGTAFLQLDLAPERGRLRAWREPAVSRLVLAVDNAA